ncbi:MAG: hypothetical protein D6753_10205 [Planctomycetota bacterium]|nr:MAG: hypothetical protein D6753_10205 [Planctomycetota bacterium]
MQTGCGYAAWPLVTMTFPGSRERIAIGRFSLGGETLSADLAVSYRADTHWKGGDQVEYCCTSHRGDSP